MGEIIEFIFSNMFVVILIISGIVGFLSNKKEEEKKTQQQQRNTRPPQRKESKPNPTRTPSGPRREQVREVYTADRKPEKQNVAAARSMEAEQQSQMERLEAKYGVRRDKNDGRELSEREGVIFNEPIKRFRDFSEEQEVLKKDIRRSLRKKGLINGIIMAEVLGKPRSLKPYESATMERYRK